MDFALCGVRPEDSSPSGLPGGFSFARKGTGSAPKGCDPWESRGAPQNERSALLREILRRCRFWMLLQSHHDVCWWVSNKVRAELSFYRVQRRQLYVVLLYANIKPIYGCLWKFELKNRSPIGRVFSLIPRLQYVIFIANIIRESCRGASPPHDDVCGWVSDKAGAGFFEIELKNARLTVCRAFWRLVGKFVR